MGQHIQYNDFAVIIDVFFLNTLMNITCNHFFGYIISNGNNFLKLFPEDLALIAQAILEGIAIMVSDRSYKPLLSTKIGAETWILE
jgi:hypothetical protein